MENKSIVVKGARENNLKNLDITIPRNKLVVMTGLSGSGKTSLAFDTIYKEGQRRYVESLSAYARQFLGNAEKPDVDSIEGLSPAISIDQKSTSKNPRSTVGTVTEIYDYLRLLYARVGKPICPTHGIEITSQNVEQIVNKILEAPLDTRIQILSPIVFGRKGTHEKTLELLRKDGYVRARINGEIVDLSDDINLDKNKNHTIEVVVDRIKIKDGIRSRLYESIETALNLAGGKTLVLIGHEEHLFSETYSCPHCDFTISELEPRLFSFNSPFGACDNCKGLGYTQAVSEALLVPDDDLTINQGAIRYLKNQVGSLNIEWQLFSTLCDYYGINMDIPYKELSDEHKDIILYGSKEAINYQIKSRSNNVFNQFKHIEGIASLIYRRYMETNSQGARDYYAQYLSETTCQVCHGKRLSVEALSVKIDGKDISEITDMSIKNLLSFFENLSLNERDTKIADLILKEIKERLKFLVNVGLDYLTLSRSANTLSGGESQRIRLATQIGSRLTGVLYVLDEPSIGLHQRDNRRLIDTLKSMRDLGNTLIVVEHDEEMMLEADHLIDIGPGAGRHGGTLVAQGTPVEVSKNKASITGKYLSKQLKIDVPTFRRVGNGNYLKIVGAEENNLKNIDVDIPLGLMTCVTGVSGSGKSTLVNEIIYKSLAKKLYRGKHIPGKHQSIKGYEFIEKVIDVNQSPIGRTPRSNPATYTGVFDNIRDLFAATKEAKSRGYNKGRFSFNVKGGRCETCNGDGVIKIEMHFLPDVYVQCDSCHGKRYNSETLTVKYKGKNISDVLDMTVEESLEFFEHIPSISNKLQTLNDVGLGYIKLGQSAVTLSGGEAQRVKLAKELHKKITDKTIFILDEPTTGLHIDDIKKLLNVLNEIVNQGGTVLIIEHNLEVIKFSDYVIDLGPEGGDEGGLVVATGTPEDVAKIKKSYTGYYLKDVLRDK